MEKLTCIASGDAFVTRRLPPEGTEALEALQGLIGPHDVKFSNLEMTFHDLEGSPSAVSGGTWAMADPRCLDDMKRYGFNLFTTANNHTADYGEGGITATIRHLRERDMVFSGSGANLAEASRACYLETRKGRVALVSACSTFRITDMAGGQSGEVPGRPGLNPLRFTKTYHVTEEYFRQVQNLARVTYINAYEEHGVHLGYVSPKPEGIASLGGSRFALDSRCWVETVPQERDMVRLEKEIREAGRQADVVLVSLHAHETDYDDLSVPPAYLETAARRCIDAGAAAVIGHGPHELRGIELYHGGAIFYSLGNFIFQTETVSLQPYEAYDNKGMPPDTKVGEYMDKRSNHGTSGYPAEKNIWRSVLAEWAMEDGKVTGIRLHPITLGMGRRRTIRGTPALSKDEDTLLYLAHLSEPYGTKIQIQDGTGYIEL